MFENEMLNIIVLEHVKTLISFLFVSLSVITAIGYIIVFMGYATKDMEKSTAMKTLFYLNRSVVIILILLVLDFITPSSKDYIKYKYWSKNSEQIIHIHDTSLNVINKYLTKLEEE